MIPAMQHSKEYYESLIRVIDCLASGQKEISPQKGEQLAGPYWNDIGESLKSEKHIYFHNNRLSANRPCVSHPSGSKPSTPSPSSTKPTKTVSSTADTR